MLIKQHFDALLHDLSNSHTKSDFLARLVIIAEQLGFQYCVIGVRAAYPLRDPPICMASNYPSAWQDRYAEKGYVYSDPVVLYCLHNHQPLIWSSVTSTASFWVDADRHGIRHGWSQSQRFSNGVVGIFTLSRSETAMSNAEVYEKQCFLIWLAQQALHVFIGLAACSSVIVPINPLGNRERQVLRWIAEGKSITKIAEMMGIREPTVRFHLHNIFEKLNVPNKTAASVKAVSMGWL